MAPMYTKIFLLGSGSYGSAWVVQEKGSSVKKVMKEVKLLNLSEKDVKQAVLEVAALARCKHDNIIRYYEAFADKNTMILSILMDYASEGDLHKHIAERRGLYFPNEIVLRWFTQLLSALAYIHKRGILHRDIKPQNLFVDEKYVLKLGDFGICRILQFESDVAFTMIGTPFYLSPEICLQQPYNCKSDMWSAGCVLYELCCLHVPFTAANLPSLTAKITAGVYNPLPCHCDQRLCNAVQNLLVANPDRRLSAEELLQSSAFEEFSKIKGEDYLLPTPCTPKMKGEQKVTLNGRKRQASFPLDDGVDLEGPVKGRDWQRSEKQVSDCMANKGIDSTTYTVLRHPKLRHLSPASSPELSQLLDRQRSNSSLQFKVREARKVQSVDAPLAHRRKPKSAYPPRLNLQQAVTGMTSQGPKEELKENRPQHERIELDADCLQQMTEAIYQFHTTDSSLEKEKSISDIKNQLLTLLGSDKLALVLAAIREKTAFATLSDQLCLGPGVLQGVLWYLTLQHLSYL
ncbi:hypothetical protein RRG08_044880 [Elysia crispata]|uniref:non-specific serine/threonine protein kinase n=1 Tax=Elysia crispata TaxID=231223 RepID=A0AAE1CEQ6_9GAST|nr:hypothetical protein RRG08_044880 [Elysia crispata]